MRIQCANSLGCGVYFYNHFLRYGPNGGKANLWSVAFRHFIPHSSHNPPEITGLCNSFASTVANFLAPNTHPQSSPFSNFGSFVKKHNIPVASSQLGYCPGDLKQTKYVGAALSEKGCSTGYLNRFSFSFIIS